VVEHAAVAYDRTMPDDTPWTQLATRIPKSLHRALKLRCVESDVSLMVFVVEAIQEKLARVAPRRAKRRRAK
jgi:predicted HicB family RNase H-like nuclease